MSEWTDVSLGTLAAPNNGAIAIGPFGSAMKADTYVPSGVPVIRGTNISNTRAWKGDWVYISDNFADSMPRCVVKANTLVFPHRGSVGEVALVPTGAHSRYFLSTSLMKIDLDEKKANPLFVYYFFKSRAGREEILKYASQVGTPGIGQPLASLRSFKLPYPPLPIQRGIASILGALDDKIELNRQMNETLEAMARAVFKDWFVDFGPTRAKMEGRIPYLAPEIWSLFPDRLDKEGKPDGWIMRPLGEVSDVSWGDTTTTKASYARTGFPAYSASGQDGFLSYADYDQKGIVLSAIGANCGQTWLASGKWSCIKNTIRILPINPFLSVEYIYLATNGTSFWPKRGSAQPFISQTDARRQFILVPSEHSSKIFSNLSGSFFERMAENLKENKRLAVTRDLLLPKLMSGEIRVRDAEKIMAAVA